MSVYQYQPIAEPLTSEAGAAGQSRDPVGGGVTVITYGRKRQYEPYAAPVLVPAPTETFQPQFLTWLPKAPDRIYGKSPLRHQGRHQFFTPRLPELPGWWQPASEPRWGRYPKAIPTDWSVLPPLEAAVTNPEFVRRWLPETNQPIFDRKRLQYTYPWLAEREVGQPEPRADSWLRYWPDPTRRVPTANHQWLYDPLPPPFSIIPPPPAAPHLSWAAQYPDFARGRIPTYLLGPYVVWYTETGPDIDVKHRAKFSLVIRHKRRH